MYPKVRIVQQLLFWLLFKNCCYKYKWFEQNLRHRLLSCECYTILEISYSSYNISRQSNYKAISRAWENYQSFTLSYALNVTGGDSIDVTLYPH